MKDKIETILIYNFVINSISIILNLALFIVFNIFFTKYNLIDFFIGAVVSFMFSLFLISIFTFINEKTKLFDNPPYSKKNNKLIKQYKNYKFNYEIRDIDDLIRIDSGGDEYTYSILLGYDNYYDFKDDLRDYSHFYRKKFYYNQ